MASGTLSVKKTYMAKQSWYMAPGDTWGFISVIFQKKIQYYCQNYYL